MRNRLTVSPINNKGGRDPKDVESTVKMVRNRTSFYFFNLVVQYLLNERHAFQNSTFMICPQDCSMFVYIVQCLLTGCLNAIVGLISSTHYYFRRSRNWNNPTLY